MIEDRPADRRPLGHGDPPHRGLAAGAEGRVHLIDLADEASPGAADRQGRPLVRARDWVRRFGFREQAVPPAVAPRPVRVPAIEERGLLVDIGDLGGHLRQEVQRVEHAEVRLVPGVDCMVKKGRGVT